MANRLLEKAQQLGIQPTGDGLATTNRLTQKARQLGITPIKTEPKPEDPTAGAGLPILGLLAAPGQVLGKAVVALGSRKSKEAVNENLKAMSEMQKRFFDLANKQTDPAKRDELTKQGNLVGRNIEATVKRMSGLQQRELEGQKIPGIAPALSDKPLRAVQQVLGRGATTAAVVYPGLGPAGAGALYGLGESAERGSDLKETAIRTGGYALGGKILGTVTGAVAKTQIGQKLLGSRAAKVVLGAFEKITAKPAVTQPEIWNKSVGKFVDMAADKFGSGVNAILSPSAYIRGGQALKILKSPQEKLLAKEARLEQKFRDVINPTQRQTQLEARSGKRIEKILVREGVPLESYKESGKIKLDTTKAREMLQVKARAENAAFQGVLKDSGHLVNLDDYAKSARTAIKSEFRGTEQLKALRQFEKELSAWKGQWGGKNTVPVDKFNEFKQYMWEVTPGFGTPDAVLTNDVNYLMGRQAKGAIERAVPDADIKVMNEYLGDLSYAINILGKRHGSIVPGGAMGKYFARTLGAIVGAQGGPLGSIGGAMTADKLAEYMMRPEISAGMTFRSIEQLRKQLGIKAEDVISQAYRIIAQRAAQRASTLRLPAPRFTPLGPSTVTEKFKPAEYPKGLFGYTQKQTDIKKAAGLYKPPKE